MSIGMTTDEFWNASPFLAKAYREAHKLKQRQRNEFAWLQGLYICNAVGVAVGNILGGKGKKKNDYMKEPVDLGLETEAEKRNKAEREKQKIIASLTAWKKAWDKAHKSGEKK